MLSVTAASLGMALVSLIEAKGADLEGSRTLMYSYGSGLAAGMFVLKGRAVSGAFALQHLQSKVQAVITMLQQLLVTHDWHASSTYVCVPFVAYMMRLLIAKLSAMVLPDPKSRHLICMHLLSQLQTQAVQSFQACFFIADLQVLLHERLQRRSKCSPAEFVEDMLHLEQRFETADYTPMSSITTLQPHTYYLGHVDHAFCGSYSRV